MASDNPARVLYDNLDVGRQSVENADFPALRVWSGVFGSGGAELARRLGRLQQLPQTVRARVTELGIDPQPVDRAMGRIEVAWLEQMQSTWSNFWNAVGGDGALDFIQITANYIDAASEPDDRYPIDDVEGLRGKLEELAEEVRASDLADDVKRIVLERLAALIDELKHLDVSSTIYFRQLVEGFVGLLATADTLYNALRESAVGRAVLSAIGALIIVHGSAVAPAKQIIELGPPNHAIVRCLDPDRVPALSSGPADEPRAPSQEHIDR